jgi:hypothetical protein
VLMERVMITHGDGSVGEWKLAPGLSMPAESLKALAEVMIKPTPLSVDIIGVPDTPTPPRVEQMPIVFPE